jgi:HEPN domain-containing protein
MDENIDVEKISAYWLQTSDDDYAAMKNMFGTKNYNWALFLGHLVLEKLLKGVVVKVTGKPAPFTHNLVKLSELAQIELVREQLDWIETITTFNMHARYDNFKRQFYLRCTLKFTTEWIDKIEQLRRWIKNEHFQ